MFNFFQKFFGKYDFESLIKKINLLEKDLEKLSNSELKEKSGKLKSLAISGYSLDAILPEAFALVRESAKRTLNQRPFDVQLIGGIVLHQGKIAEMKTGEGKTLAAVGPAYLNALTGNGVHIITVNDYLARRDVVWMGQIYFLLGLSVSCLTHEQAFLYDPEYTEKIQNPKVKIQNDNLKFKIDEKDEERDILGGYKVVQEFLRPVSRKEAYLADITYGTNNEFGFDYLRDNLAYQPENQVQIRYTPNDDTDQYGLDVNQREKNLREHAFNYAIIDEVDNILIDEARTPLIIAVPDIESSEYYKIFARIVDRLFEEEDYLVDEKLKTVSITDKGIDKVEKMLKIENFYGPENFRMVHYLEESLKAKVLFHRDKQYVVKNNEVLIVDEFTSRLMHGRRYSAGLHQAIEAKENVLINQESRTFAQITFQNYFRLYKKIAGMTGTAQTSAEEFHKVYNLEAISIPLNKPVIRDDAPDLIYKNTKTKYQAVLEEIKKCYFNGQPVLVGTASIVHNEILSNLLNQANIPHEVLNAKNHEREGEIIAQAGKLKAVTVATNMAGRGVDIILGGYPPSKFKIQGSKFKINENDFNLSEEYKEWLIKEQKVKELGGLHIIGTERHEARRIDNQLRGRAARQGDPGSSQFFLSLEDDLLRIFGGEKIKSLMEAFNLPEDQPIKSKLVSRAVNEAQKKIEGLNFDSRKHLLEYDDVLNKQRIVFYKKRQELLSTQANTGKIPHQSALMMLDILWMNHLENLEALRESVGMRAYGQHDPLVEYKRESFLLFKEMMGNFNNWLEEKRDGGEEIRNEEIDADRRGKKIVEADKREIIRDKKSEMRNFLPSNFSSLRKIGRNDPCPCNKKDPITNKPIKYKKCHGK